MLPQHPSQHPSQRRGALHRSGRPRPDHDQRRDLVAYRILVEAWAEASAKTWTRRAVQLEDARPRRGDYNGLATRADLIARWDRLTAAADACRARATGADNLAIVDLAHTAAALAPPTDDDLINRLEPQLRAALDAGDSDEATRLADLIDVLDGYATPTTTEAVTAA